MITRENVRIGVVGLGRLAREVHLPLLRSAAGVEVRVLSDPDVALLQEVSEGFPGSEAVSDPMAACAHQDLDAVLVSSPTAHHAEQALVVLDAGHHLYVEKPLAHDLESAARVYRAAEGRPQVATVGFAYRFDPAYRALRELLASASLGEVWGVRSVFVGPARAEAPNGGTAWRFEGAGSGALLDLFSHDADLLSFLGLPVEAVDGARAAGGGVTVNLQGELAGGVLFQGCYGFRGVPRASLMVEGEAGVVSYDRYGDLRLRVRRRAPAPLAEVADSLRQLFSPGQLVRKRRSPWGLSCFGYALDDFLDAVRGAPLHGAGLAQGMESLRVVEWAQDALARSSEPLREVAP